jgi:hypothetical protein
LPVVALIEEQSKVRGVPERPHVFVWVNALRSAPNN